MKHTYTVTGMTCNGCKNSVEKSLSEVPNVQNVAVDLDSSEAKIEMSKDISIETLQKFLSDKYTIKQKNIFELTSNSKTKVEEEKSELKQLFPLFLIFGYLIISSFLLNKDPWSTSGFMLDFMGLFYIVFSFFKLLDLKVFPESFRMYDPMAKALPPILRVS